MAKKKGQRYKPPVFKHQCAGQGCSRQIDTKWKFCARCQGVTRRPNVDALSRRLPGSFGG